MSLYLKQSETKTQMQDRLAKDLQDRAKRKAAEEANRPDGVTDSAFVRNTKQTTSLAWVWLLIIASVVGIIVWLLIAS